MKLASAFFLFACLLLAAHLHATNYFVATTGSDNTNDGRSTATPFRTIGRAAALVNPGDTVTVAAGDYSGPTLTRSGSAAAPIVFRSATPGAAKISSTVFIRASYIEFTGFDVTNQPTNGAVGPGFLLVGHHLRILNNDIHDSFGDGINGFANDYLTIEGNRLFRNGNQSADQASGVYLFQPRAVDHAPGFHIVIRGNQLFENESKSKVRSGDIGVGVTLEDFRNTSEGSTAGPYRPATLIENNLIYSNGTRAVVIGRSDNIVVRHNTAWNNLRIPIPYGSVARVTGSFSCQETDRVQWVNNIVVGRAASDVAIFDSNTTNTTWDYNVVWNGVITVTGGSTSVMGAHTYLADPRLVAPAAGNFRPGLGSPAVDAGNSAQAATIDIDGTARPIGAGVDIGAYENALDTTTPAGRVPAIVAQPITQTALTGALTTLSIQASGSAPLRYQWNKNGVAIAGATGVAFTIISPQPSDAGDYSVTVTNPAGSVTSNAATVSIASPPNFVWRNPLPGGGTLNAVAYGGGRFVAVGTGGRVLTSPDGTTWTVAATIPVTAPATALNGLVYDGRQWVLVGAMGMFTSPDASIWTQRFAVSSSPWLNAVTYADNQFVAVGLGGVIVTSRNGVDWVERSSGVTSSLSGIAGTTGRFVATGGGVGTLLTSPDAAVWTRITLPNVTSGFSAVAFLVGQFIAVGPSGLIYSSADGLTWTDRSSPGIGMWFNAITQFGAQLVLVGYSDQAVVTPNLASFNRITIPFNSTAVRWAIASGSGQVVAVGGGGDIASSPDLLTWTQRGTTGLGLEQRGAAFLNTQWLVMSSGGVLTSPDAVTWTRRTTSPGINGATYANGRYYAVGDSGHITSSVDAVTWVGNSTASGTNQSLTGIAFANGRFVAVGNSGVVRTSTDGNTWSPADSGVTTNLNALGVFDGRFVAVGDGGVIRTSANGLTWSGATSGTTQPLRGIGTNGNIIHVVGGNRTLLSSTDLQTWVVRSGPSGDAVGYNSISLSNGGWIVVGGWGAAAFSADGVNWNLMPNQGYSEHLLGVASNGRSTVAVGGGGTILEANNPSAVPSRLVNVATRGLVQPGGTLTPGFVLRGTGSKQVVVRAIGPTLSAFGLFGLSDLKLDVVNQQTQATAATNDDWGGSATLTNAFASLGAFPLPATSKDAAVQTSLPVNQGGYSVRISASGTASTGVALAEVYDVDSNESSSRLINVSTLGFVGTGENVLTPGFVIRGTVPKLVLIRAVGPGLAQLGVTGLLADPQFSVFSASTNTVVAANNDWGSTAALKATFLSAGAFAFPDGSKDAAVVVTLPPGGYTVVTSGVGNTTGTALVEVYDLDP